MKRCLIMGETINREENHANCYIRPYPFRFQGSYKPWMGPLFWIDFQLSGERMSLSSSVYLPAGSSSHALDIMISNQTLYPDPVAIE